MPEIMTWILGGCVITAAATVQAITGFGFALVAMPFLIFIFEPKIAVGLSLMLSFCTLLTLLVKVKKDAQWDMVKALLAGAILGIPLGIAILYYFDPQLLKILISFVIIVLSICLVFRINLNINTESKKWQMSIGSLSGVLTSSIGMPGPPIILFMSNLDLSKEKFRATCAAYFTLIYPSTFIILIVTGALPVNILLTVLTLVPFGFIGSYIGRKIFNFVPAEKFKKLILILLIVVGTYSIITSL